MIKKILESRINNLVFEGFMFKDRMFLCFRAVGMVVYKEVLCSSLTSSTHNVVTITKTLEEVENEERVQDDKTLVNC